MEAGKKRLAGDTARQATSSEVTGLKREARDLKEVVAEQTLELRLLLVNGYVRPENISRQNETTYDKIASARISYGGRGQISDVQQPRYGRQVLEAILPF